MTLPFCFQLAFSQVDHVFNYNYPLEWQYDCNTMSIKDSNYYFGGDIARITELCEYVLYGFHVTKVKSNGIKDTTIIYDKCEQTSYIGWNGAMKFDSENLIILGQEINSPAYSRFFLLTLDNNLDTVSNSVFMDDTITKRAFNFVFDNEGNIVVAGGTDSSYNEMTGLPETTYSKSSLCKVRRNGEIIWQHSYSFGDVTDGCWSSFHYITNTYDKGYIMTGRTSDFGNSRNFILKTDSLGNQQWVRFYGNYSFRNPAFSDIIATLDSCYIVCGAYTYGETFGGLYPYDGWLIKLDNNGNEKWNKKYRDYVVENTDWRDTIYNVFNGLVELEDGRIAAVATSKNGTVYGRKPKLYVFNVAGDSIFTKLYETENPWYNPTTIQITNDNGFAIAGYGDFYDWVEENNVWVSSQRIFLIKTDSLGNDSLINDIAPIQSYPIMEFKLICYPNPANSEFFVDLPQDFEDDIIEIYSTTGSLVHVQTVGYFDNRVDIDNLESGMYLLKLREKGLYGKLIIE